MSAFFIRLSLISALAAAPALAATIVPQQTRPATEAEASEFGAWYASTHPQAGAVLPRVDVRRFNGKDEWRVMGASVDSPARRGQRALCIVERTLFVNAKGWKQEGDARQLAWLEAKGCSGKGGAIEVLKRLPESDIVELLERQGSLLSSARLLFAGNTHCARQRANTFVLKAIDLGAAVEGTEEMAGLRYLNDRGGSATIWVRRSGLDYTAWNVSCAPASD